MRSKVRVQQIIRAVITHDPSNQHLPELKALYAKHHLDFPEDYRELVKIIDSKKKGETALKAGQWSTGGTDEVYIAARAQAPVRWLMEETTPLLVLRCVKNKPLVFVQTGVPSKMEIHGSSASWHTVTLTFGEDEAQTSLARDGASQKVLVLPRPMYLFGKVLDSDTLVFRHTLMGDKVQTITFDLREFNQVIWKLREPCHWTR